jgi:hypothetical protein
VPKGRGFVRDLAASRKRSALEIPPPPFFKGGNNLRRRRRYDRRIGQTWLSPQAGPGACLYAFRLQFSDQALAMRLLALGFKRVEADCVAPPLARAWESAWDTMPASPTNRQRVNCQPLRSSWSLAAVATPAVFPGNTQCRTGKPSRATASPSAICGASPRPFLLRPGLRGAAQTPQAFGGVGGHVATPFSRSALRP